MPLVNQLATLQKRFPREHQDIASDHLALRKISQGGKWIFREGRNNLNPASHGDIAWAGALASHAHTHAGDGWVASLVLEDGSVLNYFG
jgi:hypothetical protein